jgi:hypothetical protein
LAGGGGAVALLAALLLTPVAIAGSVHWGRVFSWLSWCCVLLVAWKWLTAFVQRKKLGKVVTELRRGLPSLGLGYQQLLAAREFAKQPLTGLEHRLDLELYLTLALAALRARGADSD